MGLPGVLALPLTTGNHSKRLSPVSRHSNEQNTKGETAARVRFAFFATYLITLLQL